MVAEAAKQTVVTTPSGVEVLYQSEPKRLYRVRAVGGSVAAKGRSLEVDVDATEWVEVPSVTTVLGCLDKPALPWWGMSVGFEAVLYLHNLGLLKSLPHGEQNVLACQNETGEWVVAGKDEVTQLATKNGLTVNHVRDKAGDRGTAVHDALEYWAEKGTLPDAEAFPPSEQGYVLGLIQFLEHLTPEPEASEVMVGSVEHGYAGRYDLRIRTNEERSVVVHRTPVKGPQWARVPAGRFLIDLKTSKDVYPGSHYRQLEAYEQASIECGYEPTDARGVLLVAADGTYKFKRSTAVFEDFRVVLATWHSDQRLKGKA